MQEKRRIHIIQSRRNLLHVPYTTAVFTLDAVQKVAEYCFWDLSSERYHVPIERTMSIGEKETKRKSMRFRSKIYPQTHASRDFFEDLPFRPVSQM